jgi:hypothetical protein
MAKMVCNLLIVILLQITLSYGVFVPCNLLSENLPASLALGLSEPRLSWKICNDCKCVMIYRAEVTA